MKNHPTLQYIRDEHAALSAVLSSLLAMVERGPKGDADRFFHVVRAMLYYIDEFPEKRHHPNESQLLFPLVAQRAPAVAPVIEKLEREHARGEQAVRELQHLLMSWEFMGESRRAPFCDAVKNYVRHYLDHMHTEESHIFPAAVDHLTADDWSRLGTRLRDDLDPLAGGARKPEWDRLLSHIANTAPAPIGLGDA